MGTQGHKWEEGWTEQWKKEPSQLPSWASPGGNTQAAALARLQGPSVLVVTLGVRLSWTKV